MKILEVKSRRKNYCALLALLIGIITINKVHSRYEHVINSSRYDLLPSYHLAAINKVFLSTFKAQYDSSERNIILVLNRIDDKHLHLVDTIIIPNKMSSNIMEYSPFPTYLLTVRDVKKIIFFNYRIQAFAAYENGRLIRWGPVSMGRKKSPTPQGLFFTNWKSKKTISTINHSWIMKWYFNLDSKRGVSMHEYDLPGYPASHACIRLLGNDAKWLFDWCNSWMLDKNNNIIAYGTPVIIYEKYSYGSRKPWLDLANDVHSNTVTENDLATQTNTYIPIILARQIQRDSVQGIDESHRPH